MRKIIFFEKELKVEYFSLDHVNEYSKVKGPTYLHDSDPVVDQYNNRGFSMLPSVTRLNPDLRNLIGNFIYWYIETFVGEDLAP